MSLFLWNLPDSAHGLFGHAASLVCNRLMASWKVELNIALAAIEVLAGLAKVRLNTPSALMCKRTVNWICEFIVYQCSRPAPAHSKASMFLSCLSISLGQHPCPSLDNPMTCSFLVYHVPFPLLFTGPALNDCSCLPLPDLVAGGTWLLDAWQRMSARCPGSGWTGHIRIQIPGRVYQSLSFFSSSFPPYYLVSLHFPLDNFHRLNSFRHAFLPLCWFPLLAAILKF